MRTSTLSIWIGLGVYCWGCMPALAQENPKLPEVIPLPRPRPPSVPPPAAPPTPQLNINPFKIPSGIDPQADPSQVIIVKQFIFQGNTVFTTEQLEAVVKDFTGRPLTINDLSQVEQKIAQLYVDNGYISSGGYITNAGKTIDSNQAVIDIQIIEGRISQLQINGAKRLNGYVKNRLRPLTDKVLRESDLQETLRWLQINPLIKSLSIQLRPSAVVGQAILAVEVKPAPPLRGAVFLNNNRSPSVGTFERGASLSRTNLTGLGDIVQATYRNTNGSNIFDIGVAIPINIQDGTVSVGYVYGDNNITEKPFDQIDLNIKAQQFKLGVRQPIYRKATEKKIQEVAVGTAISHLESQDSLLGFNFPVTEGADGEGRTRSTVLSLFQEFTNLTLNDSINLRSQLNIGLPIATRNAELFTDGSFISFQNNATWTHKISKDFLWVNRAGIQVTDGAVIPPYQFSLGGSDTIKGFRQEGVTRDNGAYLATELRIPLFSDSKGTLQFVPGAGIGYAWNSQDRFLGEKSQALASVSVGLEYNLGDNLSVRLDYGIPLLNRSERRPTVQEGGLTIEFIGRF